MKGKESHCVANFVTFVPKWMFLNECNKMAIGLSGVQFWSEIILVISNRTRAARSFDFEITRKISDQIALHLVQFPLFIPSSFPLAYFFFFLNVRPRGGKPWQPILKGFRITL